MKAILEFNLPEDDLEHRRAVQALDLCLALWNIEQHLRDIDKHDKDYDISETRVKFYSILADHDINLDTLIE